MEKYRGTVNSYDLKTGKGSIRAQDGLQIDFSKSHLVGVSSLSEGDVVIYEVNQLGDEALKVELDSISLKQNSQAATAV